jgi:hypothetical protein
MPAYLASSGSGGIIFSKWLFLLRLLQIIFGKGPGVSTGEDACAIAPDIPLKRFSKHSQIGGAGGFAGHPMQMQVRRSKKGPGL